MVGERTRQRGQLESDIMRVLWQQSRPLTVREIMDHIAGRTPAHTTLLTSLDRLCTKGLVLRVGEARRGMQFQAATTGAEHAGEAMFGALEEADDRGAALLNFAGNLNSGDVELLTAALASQQRRIKRRDAS